MLRIQNLSFQYGYRLLFKDFHLQVNPGEILHIQGKNGAGKTTVMRAISGMVKPARGRIELNGKAVQGMSASQIARLGLAHVPEGRRVFGTLSVEDNLLLGGYSHLPHFFGFRRKADDCLKKVYDLFPRLHERRRQSAGTLSGGEQQMLAIGRAIMAEPRVILMDEPSMGLAPVIAEEVFATISRLKETGIPLLLVEQMTRKALEVANYVYVMEHGMIVLQGNPEKIRKDERVIAAYLG